MDQASSRQWAHVGDQQAQRQQGVADRVLALLRSLAGITDGFAVDQLHHGLQTATRAERDGAGSQVVVAALCHDIGKTVSQDNHAAIGAEILRPYVDDDVYQVVRAHGDFQGRYWADHLGGDAEAREQHRQRPWFALAERFADEWDQRSFDPAYDTLALEHFEPLVRQVFATRASGTAPQSGDGPSKRGRPA